MEHLYKETEKRLSKMIDEVILRKLFTLKVKTFNNDDYDLYSLLTYVNENMTANDVKDLVVKLQRDGYTIDVEYPQVDYLISEDVVKAEIDVSKLKLKVTKVIYEV